MKIIHIRLVNTTNAPTFYDLNFMLFMMRNFKFKINQ